MRGYPAPCSEERRQELRNALTVLAKRMTRKGTLTELAAAAGVEKYTMSRWIRAGEVNAKKAAQLLKHPKANPSGQKKITLKQLTPSLF